ncbi:hypothetical protein D3C77_243220 [compost metagenome]
MVLTETPKRTSPWKAATSSVRAPSWMGPVRYFGLSRATAAVVWLCDAETPCTMRTPSNCAADKNSVTSPRPAANRRPNWSASSRVTLRSDARAAIASSMVSP